MKKQKIAIVYDWLDKWGGVERVILTLCRLFPSAVLFTSYVDFEKAQWAKGLNIKTSFLQSTPKKIRTNRRLSTPLYSYAFESLDFSRFDTVISVSSSFAKGVITNSSTKHISYILTPSRFLWTSPDEYLTNRVFKILSKSFKRWDYAAAQRPDTVVTISENVRKRVQKFYKRDSLVIYPPFDLEYWQNLSKQLPEPLPAKFFLLVSRLEPYKKVSLAVDVFNSRHDNLVIVGKGSLEKKLKRRANKNVLFLSDLTDSQLAGLYSRAEALIMPQEEDFGYVGLESLFFGLPVISFNKGGITEIIEDERTGLFFEKQNIQSLESAIERFTKISYNLKNSAKKTGPSKAKEFDNRRFEEEFKKLI